jgi:hypothetical protein
MNIKHLEASGFKQWGLVIPGALHAPAGSKTITYRKGKHTASVVVAPDGTEVRGFVTYAHGTFEKWGDWGPEEA